MNFANHVQESGHDILRPSPLHICGHFVDEAVQFHNINLSGLFSLLLADLWPSLPGQEGQASAQLCPHEDCELRRPYLTASRATFFNPEEDEVQATC
jgi:hypothetical protein